MNELHLVISFIDMIKEVKDVTINLEENVAEIHLVEEILYLHSMTKGGKTIYVISGEEGQILSKKFLDSTEVIDFFIHSKEKVHV